MRELSDILLSVIDASDLRGDARQQWEKCESPIEQILCIALFQFLGCEAVAGTYHPRRRTEMASMVGQAAAFLFAQHPIGSYRADFLIVTVDPLLRRSRSFVVECDGKDFHDAERDQLRDERIRAHGPAGIIRVRGSDIFYRPKSTAQRIGEIIGLLAPAADGELSAEEERVERYRESLRTGIWDDLPSPDFL